MSATAPPDHLERARRELAGRGYLAGPTPRPPGARATAARLALFAAVLALLLAAAEVGFSGQRMGMLPPLAAGFLPAALVAVAGGYGVCRWLAATALRLGGEPGSIASTVGVLVGASLVAVLAAMGKPLVTGVATLPAVVGGVLAALAATAWMRRHLLGLLAFPAPPPAPRSVAGAIFPVVVVGGVVAVLALAHRSDEPQAAQGVAFPPPQGRVAIVAVTGWPARSSRRPWTSLAATPCATSRCGGGRRWRRHAPSCPWCSGPRWRAACPPRSTALPCWRRCGCSGWRKACRCHGSASWR
ncbi:MAG: hypothetical protein HXY19_01115 [Thermoanaerobaculaceae bacterium]|nr:hypothetical protein [Thermoanaerobaculaceae bacterium]